MENKYIDWKETYRHAMFCIAMLNEIRKIEKNNEFSKTKICETLAYDIKCFYCNQVARSLYILRCRAKDKGSDTQPIYDKYMNIWNQTIVEGHHKYIDFECSIEMYLNCLNDILKLLMPNGMPLTLQMIDDFVKNESKEVQNKITDLRKIN